MYMCHLLVYRARRLKELGGFRSEFDGSQDHDMALRFCEITDRVQHIPRVLYHWRRHDRSFSNAADSTGGVREAGCRAVEAAIVRRGLKATVTPTAAAGYRVAFTRSWSPRVSVVIPMRDRPELLRRLLGSIEAYRTYPNYELLVVDNASVMPETLSWLAGLERTDARIRVLRDGRAFNFSRLNNVAAAEAHGDVLLFLNNDTEVTHDDWLEPMLEHITRPDVGAVGTLLLFPNGTVQHAGITVAWPRGPAHKFRRWPVSPARNLVHYQAMTFDSDVAAVTGACMMVRRDVYHSAGGFDEEMFPVAFNDVDLCLRLRGMGHRIVFTPRTRLVHHESVSRGTGYDPYEVAALEARWKARCGTDPFWNPNLLSHNEGMLLARPWRMPEDGVLLGTLADTGRIQRPGE
jgi:GT2 family glycosyltransferase